MARAYNQAQKFGAEMAIPDEVSALSAQTDSAGNFTLKLSNGEQVTTRSVVVASGARYRRPAVENLHAFEGASVHYWATPLEGKLCANQEITLIGGGNSAGQGAVSSHRAVAQTSSLRQNQKPSSLRFDGGGPMAVTMRNRMALTRRAVMKSTVATAACTAIGGIACPSLSFAPDRPQITHGIQSRDVSVGSRAAWTRAHRPAPT